MGGKVLEGEGRRVEQRKIRKETDHKIDREQEEYAKKGGEKEEEKERKRERGEERTGLKSLPPFAPTISQKCQFR